jgi:hypothetical protein
VNKLFITRYGFSSEPFLWNCHTNSKVSALLVSNGIYDEIKIDETLDSINSIEKEDWTLDTAFNAKFQNNLEAGNLSNNGIPIQYIRFKRRKIGELNWETMVDEVFYKDIENYNVIDYFIENATEYEYMLVPVTQSTEGQGVSSSIETDYFSLFLTGRDNEGNLKNYPLRFDMKTSDITTNADVTYQKTLSSKYPARLCGESNYLTGNVVVKLISLTTELAGGKVDMKAEKIYREAFEEFIHSGKPMLIRNHSLYILGTIGEPKKNPAFDEEVAFGIYDFSLAFTEYDDAKNMTVLKNNNLYYTVETS